MRRFHFILQSLVVLCVSTMLLASVSANSSFNSKPRLLLVLVFDQMRADYLFRFEDKFLPAKLKDGRIGGFSYLMKQGAYFPLAQQDILQTMTCPGHSMILSGTYPYQSGIPLNNWYNAKTGEAVYCAEDSRFSIVGIKHKPDPHAGTSPENFIGSMLGDELKNAGKTSRVVSVAIKDRAAIFLGGHRADLALWFDSGDFKWVSSNKYLQKGALPPWIEKLNSTVDKYQGKAVLNSPLGYGLTNDAAEAALDNYHLGANDTADILAVSYSNFDVVGHAFGPNSSQMEEMTIQADRAVSNLLNYVQKKIPGGLKDALIVLTSDHGTPPDPQVLSKDISAGHIDQKVLLEKIETKLTEKFGSPKKDKWIAFENDFNFYFNQKVLEEKKVEMEVAEKTVKEIITAEKGIAFVFSRSDVHKKNLPPGVNERRILKTYFDDRSGDVIALPRPFFMNTGNTVNHMTSYSYDRTIPLIFAGKPFKPGVYAQGADTVDIAPTLSFILGVLPPSSSEGRVLTEAFP